MNCKHCGSKLGVLERWRYGDFCSQKHQHDFAGDVVRLNEQIVKDLRRIPNRLKGQAGEPVELGAPLQHAEGPPPPEAGFVPAPDSAPVPLAVEPAAPELPPAPCSRSSQWRLFARVADWSRLPAGVLAASQKRQLRFVWVAYAEDSVPAHRGTLLSGEYPAFLPHPELRRWQAHLQMALHSEPSAIVTPAAPLTIEQRYWVDDQGWRWIPEGTAMSVPDFGPVLSEYPVAAPWLNWTVGAGLTPRSSSAQPSQPLQSGARPPMTAAGIGSGHSAAFPAGAPVQMAWPGGPAWAGGMVGYAPYPSAIPPVPPWGMGLVWQELPPPLFNALVDPSQSVRPLPGVVAQQHPPAESISGMLPRAPQRPAGPAIPPAAFALIDCPGDPLEDVTPASSQPVRCDWQPRTLWRRMLGFPAHAVRASQPGVPRRAAPPLGLRLRPLRPAPTATPVLYSGRWID